MITLQRAHRALDAAARLPGVRSFLRREHDRRFESNTGANLFRGVFATFDEALASAPANRPHGYDNESSAALYLERSRRLYATDYPVLFWLARLGGEGPLRVFDLGGHIGVSYYAYRRHLAFPEGARWVVHDVPAVMARGRVLAAGRDPDGRLGFADRFDEAADADVLLAQGSLQYLPDTLGERLLALPRRPRHLLVNLTPLHETLAYFTLQSIGTAYCPYRVDSVPGILAQLDAAGYDLLDQWENPDKKCTIPFHPRHSLDQYYGFCFRRRD